VGSWDVGGLVGWNYNEGTVSRSYSTGSVVGNWSVGGLVGYSGGIVSKSYSTGSVVGKFDVGGFVGQNDGTVIQSYSTCSVSGNQYVGGLVGDNHDTVSQSYSTGSVGGKDRVGGLVGQNYNGAVSQSYWDIETSGQSTSEGGGEGKTTAEMKQQATFVGWDFDNVWAIEENVTYPYLRALGQPIQPPPVVEKEIWSLSDLNKIGRYWEYPMDGHYTLMVDIDASETVDWDGGKGFKPIVLLGRFYGNGHVIRNLYINRPGEGRVGLFGHVGSRGQVKNVGLDHVQVVGNVYVGGLVGNNEGTVSQTYSTGSVSGNSYVGGLVGYNYWGGTVRQSYFTGSVAGTGYYVGGLVGWNDSTVSHSCSTGSVVGNQYVGGLVGGNDNDGTVTQSYSTGSVVGNQYVGGLVGDNYNGTVSQSYWDIETSGQSTSAGGEGMTTAQMKQRTTFTGWDFDCVWNIVEGVDYPYLRWEKDEVPEGCEGIVEGAKEGEGIVEGEGITEGEGTNEGTPDGEGIKEGEGQKEGTIEGSVEGMKEGEGSKEGVKEGEGSTEGSVDGAKEGEGIVEGEGITEGEGTNEGTPDGEGIKEGEGQKEGTIEGSVEGMKEGEGSKEGVKEGEGSTEGSVDGAKEGEGSKEGGKEGQVGTEGSPSISEGEGSTETPTETKQGCGCSGKSLGNDTWWKYILDVILFGMLIVSMSGMRRRR